MDDDDVVAVLQKVRIPNRVGVVDLLLPARERMSGPLKAVVDRLRHPEEGLVSPHQLPVGREPEVAQHRHLGAKDLRQPAPVRRRVQMEDTPTPKPLCERTHLRHDLCAGARLIRVEGLGSDIDGLEHRS